MTKRQLIAILIFIFAVSTSTAQRPRYEKLSPMLRELVRATLPTPSSSLPTTHSTLHSPHSSLHSPHSSLHTTHSTSQEVCAFIRMNDDAEPVFERYHVRPLCHYGSLYIAMIPIGSLHGLSLEKSVSRIEARPSGQVLMDSVVHQINAHIVHEGLGSLPQAYTGRGVVMGVMDIGFDLTHPTFYSRDTTEYRIKAFWDQLSQDTVGSNLPVGRDYVTRTDLLTVAHARDGLDQSHGTHTLGTAAGSGYDSPYRGIAPESDICIVANAVSDDIVYIDSTDYYKYTFATDALGFKYIFDYADRVGKPCVISFSEGSMQDYWGYDLLYYEMLDSLLGPGHIIVAAAGNQGLSKTYFRKPSGQSSAGTFLNAASSEMSFTLKSDRDFDLRFISYYDTVDTLIINTRTVLLQEDSTYTDLCRQGEKTMAVRVVAYPSCYHPEETCYDVLVITTNHVGSNPRLSFEVVGDEAFVEVFRVNGSFVTNALNPRLNAGEPYCNIHSPASSPSIICVGATQYRPGIINYEGKQKLSGAQRDGKRSAYSSVGPTFDGRIKPDVMAPGMNIISSYSSYYLENHPKAGDISWDVAHFDFNGRTYAWNSNSGTSMSTPAVGGAIALWLQANPRLTPSDVLDVISRTSQQNDSTLSYPNNLYGYGQIDVYHGLLDILNLTSVASLSVRQSSARITMGEGRQPCIVFEKPLISPARVRIYNLSGQQLYSQELKKGNDRFTLPLPLLKSGVYAFQIDGEPTVSGSQLLRID